MNIIMAFFYSENIIGLSTQIILKYFIMFLNYCVEEKYCLDEVMMTCSLNSG